MKKIILIVIVFFETFSLAQNLTFADNDLKNLLLAANTTSYKFAQTTNDQNQWTVIDTNGDGEIQPIEAAQIKYIRLDNFNTLTGVVWDITSIEGIGGFINLETFYCTGRPLITAELHDLPYLKVLLLTNNSLNNVNLYNLNSIEYIHVGGNNLSNINLLGLPSLQGFYCINNQFSVLNFSQLPNLKLLNCGGNNLTSLNLKNDTVHQSFNGYNDWNQGNPNLAFICADANEIAVIQGLLASNSFYNPNTVISSNCSLGNDSFIANEFEVYPNPSFDIFNIDFGSVLKESTVITVYNMLSQPVYEFSIINESSHQLSLVNFAAGTYFIKISNDSISKTNLLIKK